MSTPSKSLAEIDTQLAQLVHATSAGAALPPHQSTQAKSAIRDGKIAMATSGLLTLGLSSRAPSQADILHGRNILEYSALYSIRSHDVPSFERFMAQLSPYWTTHRDLQPPSSWRSALIGLSLLQLLAKNEIGRFHTVLETLSGAESTKRSMAKSPNASSLLDEPNVRFPIELERWLMEGSYSKVWLARNSPPLPEAQFFLDQLMGTIRNEIASCGEKAYSVLPLRDAATLLFFSDAEELSDFIKQRPGWSVDQASQCVRFADSAKGIASDASEDLPKQRLIETHLAYARELESIV
ncbi:uncharacterized protein L969DRAFT_91306 [Mixia osmundae IAM 14324]|uniref:CSN8/PSMD8/EIF3K domain-containing protein n=1 Tax=Mixia osmundae (strain CBS 9802 / IAM 14324 / JCM 22182 / KY 12970) TaxID=764103 RepID=G7DST3_MIXOS|nr:uncharacterized protein L969DRAFT_91306 [Mixia osmundae IAM 14324]KEI41825.1 hypothetical protein L969DRAFT_91306 [Mixia osmundae IAM 14324]GAA93641.1 hypothetical protein E5Q_00285 [Mixia osmundae IAM 14324]